VMLNGKAKPVSHGKQNTSKLSGGLGKPSG
jgi:hypothetical protein